VIVPIQVGKGRETVNNVKRMDALPWFVLLTTAVLLIGFASALTSPGRYAHLAQPALEQLRQLAAGAGSSPIRTWALIFFHNIIAAATFLVTGFLFGVIPVITLWYNGVLMGYVTVLGAHRLHVSDWKLFSYALLPHGILELPALIWASALGVQIGFSLLYSTGQLLRTLVTGEKEALRGRTLLSDQFRRVLRHAPFIVGMLFLAAGVESFITPKLIQWGLSSSPLK
jgi:stage II sporulation protein M